jgi:hypothetical protein
MNRSNFITFAVVLIIIGYLGSCVWRNRPVELYGCTHLEHFEKRGDNYSAYLKSEASFSDIANLSVFEGYHPSIHSDYKEKIDRNPAKYVKEDDHHSYTEFITNYGRMKFHTSYQPEEGIHDWLMFQPTDLPVDKFLHPDMSIKLDLSKDKFTVYIMNKDKDMFLTVYVKNKMVDEIAWITQ